MAAVFICFSIQRRAIADNANLVGDENLVDLLEFCGEQTIKGIVEMDLSILSLTPLNHVCALPLGIWRWHARQSLQPLIRWLLSSCANRARRCRVSSACQRLTVLR